MCGKTEANRGFMKLVTLFLPQDSTWQIEVLSMEKRLTFSINIVIIVVELKSHVGSIRNVQFPHFCHYVIKALFERQNTILLIIKLKMLIYRVVYIN